MYFKTSIGNYNGSIIIPLFEVCRPVVGRLTRDESPRYEVIYDYYLYYPYE